MSDIQKLHKVIDALEEQSLKVSEFNGVLTAVNAVKEDILLTKSSFEVVAQEQNKQVTESYKRFDEYRDKLATLDDKLTILERKILTAEQFEVARDKILLRMSELRFVSPEQFEQNMSNVEKSIIAEISQSTSNLEKLIETQNKSIRTLRIVVILGITVLACGVLYLARDLFL